MMQRLRTDVQKDIRPWFSLGTSKPITSKAHYFENRNVYSKLWVFEATGIRSYGILT